MTDEINYSIFKLLEDNPSISQRELASKLGVSLGKANYCLKALLDKGWVKAANFKNSQNKIAYSYLLTPKGIEGKTRIMARFLKRKVAEFDAIKAEIENLQHDLEATKQEP